MTVATSAPARSTSTSEDILTRIADRFNRVPGLRMALYDSDITLYRLLMLAAIDRTIRRDHEHEEDQE